MSKRNIYIAGPISDTTDYYERFRQACIEVKLLGHTSVSPIEVVKAAQCGGDWLACMRADIHALIECDGLYALRGWEHSKGARLEHLIAEGLGLEILYQPDDLFEHREDNPRLHHNINTK